MTLDYLSRLFALMLAIFFIVHCICGMFVFGVTRAAIRLAQSFQPRTTARLLLTIRFLPIGFAVLLTIGVCVPNYVRYEPKALSEPVGVLCLACSSLCVFTCLASAVRAIRALRSTAAYLDRRKAAVSPYVAGIFVSRIIVAQEVADVLSSDELSVAIAHERAHAAARDNLKRLLLLLTPGIAPFFRGYDRLEKAWARFAEWAADDAAVLGHPARALSLAEALVRLSRGNLASHAPGMTTSLFGDGSDLSARVERLLNVPCVQREPKFSLATPISAVLLLTCGVAILARAPSLLIVHTVLEHLVR
ncbi:MAG TPA: M56 family metallopeptidase [Bryobacteraceae bacterium]|nr:M56 family metallopeptidase [Bryobacteraceae bacterium]